MHLTIGQHGLGKLVKSTWQNRKFTMWTLQFGKVNLTSGKVWYSSFGSTETGGMDEAFQWQYLTQECHMDHIGQVPTHFSYLHILNREFDNPML